jgi:hypothetical protein
LRVSRAVVFEGAAGLVVAPAVVSTISRSCAKRTSTCLPAIGWLTLEPPRSDL